MCQIDVEICKQYDKDFKKTVPKSLLLQAFTTRITIYKLTGAFIVDGTAPTMI